MSCGLTSTPVPARLAHLCLLWKERESVGVGGVAFARFDSFRWLGCGTDVKKRGLGKVRRRRTLDMESPHKL